MSSNNDWLAFVIMPFDKEFEPIYHDLIVPSLEETGFIVERADSLLGQRNILKKLVEKIDQSNLVVADLTTLNPNVMYELGIAHALSKPSIMIIQDIDELPFDLRTYNAIPYSTRFNEIGRLKEELQKIARGLQAGEAFFANPVTDFAPSVIQLSQKRVVASQGQTIEAKEVEAQSTWLDLLGEGLEQLELVRKATEDLASEIVTVGNKMTERTEQLNNAQSSGLPNTPAVIYGIVKASSEDMLEYASQTESSLKTFHNAWHRFSSNFQELLNNSVINSQEDVNATEVFKSQVSELQLNIRQSADSVDNFKSTIGKLPDVSKHLTRARATTVIATEHIIEEFTTCDSSIVRIINILDEKLVIYASQHRTLDTKDSE